MVNNDQPSTTYLKETGMTLEHAEFFQKFSIQNEVITVWRPINENAAISLDKGAMGKTIGTKAKSSNFEPIAASIPFDVRLSKIANEGDNEDKIATMQKINELILAESDAIYTRDWEGKINPSNADTFNDLNLTTTVVKEDELGREICILLDNAGQISMESDNKTPKFIARDKKTQLLYGYDIGVKQFSLETSSLPNDIQLEPVKVIAYRYFSSKIAQEIFRPVTADYDELVSAPRKIFPLHNNISLTNDGQKILNKESVKIKKFLRGVIYKYTLINEHTRKEIIKQIVDYEKELKKQHREIQYHYQTTMGSVNEWQLNTKSYQKLVTEGATNHGPEVNNPYPEPLDSGKFVAFVPESGSLGILRSEQDICKFINHWRAQGFPLDVNPKWGWEIDDEGKLSVPQLKFNWVNVYQGLKALQEELKQRELKHSDLLKKLRSTNDQEDNDLSQRHNLESEGDLIELAKIKQVCDTLKTTLNAEEAIIEKKVMLERLRLEPDIVYSNFLSWEHDNYFDYDLEKNFLAMTQTALSVENPINLRLQTYQARDPEQYAEVYQQLEVEQKAYADIIETIRLTERHDRFLEVEKLTNELQEAIFNYKINFVGNSPLVDIEESRISDARSVTAEIEKKQPIKEKSAAAAIQSSGLTRYGLFTATQTDKTFAQPSVESIRPKRLIGC